MKRQKGKRAKRAKKAKWVKWVVGVMVAVPVVSVVNVIMLSWGKVPATVFMLHRGWHYQYEWVDYEQINPSLTRAVIASEDNLFATHNGFSERGIKQALKERKEKGKVRHGGSTISQQTAKNVFTTGKRTYLRKARETWYTILIETFWSKRRIMEVYLNVIEMGDGVYGAEAASKKYFHHSAKRLTAAESALLAASLPSPRRYSVVRPGPYMLKRQGQILALMPKMGRIEL